MTIDIRGVLSRSRDPLFIANPRGELLFYNRVFSELTGMDTGNPQQKLTVEKEFTALPADLPVSHARRVERSWGEGRRQKWWSILFVPIADENGDLVCVLGQISSSKDAPTEVPKASDSIVPERLQRLRIEQRSRWGFEVFPARSEAMLQILRQLRLATTTREPVAFVGEAGTGKETLARLVHHQAKGETGTLAILDCAALPPAVQREQLLGRFGTSDDQSPAAKGILHSPGVGTLIVKQVTQLSSDLQQELVRSFGREDSQWRLIVSANESLYAAMTEGRLTEEFYYLAATLVIHVPPLRERKAEFDDYCYWALGQVSQRSGLGSPSIEQRAMELLRGYDWPGNLHELQAVLDQAARRCSNFTISARDLPRRLRKPGLVFDSRPEKQPQLPALDFVLEEVERRMLSLAMERTGGNKAQAAEDLKISRARLLRRLESLTGEGSKSDSASKNDEPPAGSPTT